MDIILDILVHAMSCSASYVCMYLGKEGTVEYLYVCCVIVLISLPFCLLSCAFNISRSNQAFLHSGFKSDVLCAYDYI